MQNNLQSPAAGGTAWYTQGHGDWNIAQPTVIWNPGEWQLYSTAAMGEVSYSAGGNTVTAATGNGFSHFDSSWVGTPYLYIGGVKYQVLSYIDSTHVAVQYPGGGAVSFPATMSNVPWEYVRVSVTNTCNVTAGGLVSYVSGQPFIGFQDSFTVNGTAGTVSSINVANQTVQLTAWGGGTLTNASCVQLTALADEVTSFRAQNIQGSDEEGSIWKQTPYATYIQGFFAGHGLYHDIILGTGEAPAGSLNAMVDLHPNATYGLPGTLSLGGLWNNEALQVATAPVSTPWVNHLLVSGSQANNNVYVAARGTGTTINVNFDLQGAMSEFQFTSQSFGKNEFQIFGSGGACSTAVNSATNGQLLAEGTNCALELKPSGSQNVIVDNGLQLPSYTVSTLPTCNSSANKYLVVAVSDAGGSPAWHGAVSTGGGSGIYEVLCIGSGGWVFN